MQIRSAAAADEDEWRGLWAQYLAFYGVTLAPEITDTTWFRLLADDSPLQGRFAFDAGQMLGFALHHRHLSTWGVRPDCYLEDLFVAEAARGKGAGRALIDDLIALSRAAGDGRLYWNTDEANTRARALYDSYTPSDSHIRYRLRHPEPGAGLRVVAGGLKP